MLGDVDSDHWWFRGKAALVVTALQRTGTVEPRSGWLLDAGAGSGGVSAQLGWNRDRLAIVEGNAALARRAGAAHDLRATRGRVDQLPFRDRSIDVVCLLDVIEHIPDPRPTLAEARRALTPGGLLVVTVPAHRWLWSAADDFLGHQRRYSRRMLTTELTAAGFQPLIVTHIFSWLVAPTWLVRRVTNRGSAEVGYDKSSPLIDRAAAVLTGAERALVGRVSVPIGTSVLAVARRLG